MDSFRAHLDVDLQQRGIEFSQLFGEYEHLRTSLLEKMPVIKVNSMSLGEESGEVPAVVEVTINKKADAPAIESSNSVIFFLN